MFDAGDGFEWVGEGEGLAVYLGVVIGVEVEDLLSVLVSGKLIACSEVEGSVDISMDGLGELVGLGEIAVNLSFGVV